MRSFMSDFSERITGKCRAMPGAAVSWRGKRIDVPLPSEREEQAGSLTMIFPGGPILFNLIDIRSQEIPDQIADPGSSGRLLKVNYCAQGRCELRLCNGGCTFLTAGEISVDAGQALNSFYYPTGEYRGFEIAVSLDDLPAEYSALGETLSSPEKIYDRCKPLHYPWIRSAEEPVIRMYDTFRLYVNEYDNPEMVLLLCLELIALLSQMDYSPAAIRRTYCTASQVEIAKRTKEMILSDLSVRLTAKEFAKRFGVSETSLKNYFRNVYGCGYAEYQLSARMKEAAKLLKNTESKASDIGQAVGFASQAKFGAAFKQYFGITPLEYRRRCRLGELRN